MLKERTREFAIRVVRLAEAIANKSWAAKRLADQLLRSGTSVGAHYAEALGARSDAEFIAKIDGGLQELREALYWMGLVISLQYIDEKRVQPLLIEAKEIKAMLIASSKTIKLRRQLESNKPIRK